LVRRSRMAGSSVLRSSCIATRPLPAGQQQGGGQMLGNSVLLDCLSK
jgi:hypothetical protein